MKWLRFLLSMQSKGILAGERQWSRAVPTYFGNFDLPEQWYSCGTYLVEQRYSCDSYLAGRGEQHPLKLQLYEVSVERSRVGRLSSFGGAGNCLDSTFQFKTSYCSKSNKLFFTYQTLKHYKNDLDQILLKRAYILLTVSLTNRANLLNVF